MKHLITLFITFLGFISSAYSASPNPTDTIKHATSAIVNELQTIPVAERDAAVVNRLVQSYILPAIDQERFAKMALGKHWRKASKTQRKDFVETFRDLQIRTYSGAFAAFDGQKFEFSDARFNRTGKRAIVKGEMIQPNGQRIPIDFKMFINKQKEWKIYDAVIAGLSMVTTYRQQFSEQMQRKSLDEIILNMREQIQTASL